MPCWSEINSFIYKRLLASITGDIFFCLVIQIFNTGQTINIIVF
jgi:hypothetical protein